jgi:hypothetical protein
MNSEIINYCKNEDNKTRINYRVRTLITNQMYKINEETKGKIYDILQFLDDNTCRELLEKNINFKKIYDLFSQILEESNIDEDTVISSKRNRLDDFDLNASFNNLGLRGENTRTLIDKINELHKFLFPSSSLEDSFKKMKLGGRVRSIKKNKKNKKKTLKRKNIKKKKMYYIK